MRAGESPQAVAASTGWPLDRVTRYAEQPLAERAYIVDRAMATELRRTGGGVTLADSAATFLESVGSSLDQVHWDSERREDGKWLVTAEVELKGRSATATWSFDHADRNLHPLDEGARRLMGAASAPETVIGLSEEPAAPEPSEPLATAEPESRPHLVAVPTFDDAPVVEPDVVEPDDVEPKSAPAEEFELFELQPPSAGTQETLAIPTPEPKAKSERKTRAKGKRASIPSWDEILFGAQRHDAD